MQELQHIIETQKNSLTVQEGWTGVFRFYLPRNEQQFIDYIESLRSIKLEALD